MLSTILHKEGQFRNVIKMNNNINLADFECDAFDRKLDEAYIVNISNSSCIARLCGWTSKGRAIFQTESGGRIIETKPGSANEYCGRFGCGFWSGKWKFYPEEIPNVTN